METDKKQKKTVTKPTKKKAKRIRSRGLKSGETSETNLIQVFRCVFLAESNGFCQQNSLERCPSNLKLEELEAWEALVFLRPIQLSYMWAGVVWRQTATPGAAASAALVCLEKQANKALSHQELGQLKSQAVLNIVYLATSCNHKSFTNISPKNISNRSIHM